MTNVLIIGATGTLGNAAHQTLLNETDVKLTLFARSADRLTTSDRETAMAGNVTSDVDLDQAMQGQDVVFAALSGNLGNFAKKIVAAMDRNQVSRLLFITSMGIYDEIPASVGASGNLSSNPMLRSYREAADVIEASDLNYTIIRPGWFTGGSVNYEVTRKGEPFGGHDVSASSIADLVKRLVEDDTLYSHDSVGINTK
ncbi:NAD(P)H-binding protein [Paucilactobacillus wasatchensis]|uniref:Putative oxidoreductase (Putative) n=1 Tax=Paucilactobacillus wasatchensis TaxID=1335616 RepID=A0A0D0Y313_9LACO|nr:NAD(P)H-binding protein [Paucilactobacillus wasatchensis]KIS02633.1 putative oxidoreductase (putative) [Paucilactobacillus wasatchensis]